MSAGAVVNFHPTQYIISERVHTSSGVQSNHLYSVFKYNGTGVKDGKNEH